MPGKLQKTIKCDRIKENLWLFESSPCRVRKMRRLYRKRNLPTGTEWRSLPKKPSQQGIPSEDSFLYLSEAKSSCAWRSSSGHHACMNELELHHHRIHKKARDRTTRQGEQTCGTSCRYAPAPKKAFGPSARRSFPRRS